MNPKPSWVFKSLTDRNDRSAWTKIIWPVVAALLAFGFILWLHSQFD